MELDKLCKMYAYAKMLSNGIDPTTESSYEQDTIMNAPEVKEYNSQVSELLREMISIRTQHQDVEYRDIPFVLMDSDSQRFNISDTPITIGDFTSRLNRHALPGMKKIKATDITNRLVSMGILDEQDSNIRGRKPTSKGKEIGIETEQRVSSNGERYAINLYNSNAQRYIIENFNSILYGN